MSQDDDLIERIARLIYDADALRPRLTWERLTPLTQGEYRKEARAALSALPERELLAEALAYAHQLEQCVAEFLDAYTAFNNDELDEVSMNDAEHGMKLAMYAFREARAAADKIRASLTQEKQT